VLHQDILSHKSMLTFMSERASSAAVPDADSRLSDVIQQFATVNDTASDLVSQLEKSVNDHTKYRDTMKLFSAKLDQIKKKSTRFLERTELLSATRELLETSQVGWLQIYSSL
jgi:chemotaxis regulatin CheY-phosphate phosphatase CheZ